MIHQETFKQGLDFVGSKGLIFFGEKILVYRRDTNTDIYPLCIDLPGGGQEGAESPFETFCREVAEEFGLTLHERDIQHVARFASKSHPSKFGYFFVTNKLRLTLDDVTFGTEGIEFFLLSLEEYLSRDDAISGQQDKVKKLSDELSLF